MKNKFFFSLKIFSFGGEIFYIFEQVCFHNDIFRRNARV